MKLTDVHTNLHLTETVLQLAFSLRRLSVSYLCNVPNHHYDYSDVGNSSLNNEIAPANGPTSLHPVSFGQVQWRHENMGVCALQAASGVTVAGVAHWLRVLEGRWQSQVLAAGAVCRRALLMCVNCLQPTSFPITPRT